MTKENNINDSLPVMIASVDFTGIKSYLEIGTREGDSLRQVIELSDIQDVTVCDTWGAGFGGTGRSNHNHITQMLSDMQYTGQVCFLDGDSHVHVPKIQRTFDLILVDGDHSEEGATADLHNAWRVLADGGLMIVDDLQHVAHMYLEDVVMKFIEDVGAEIVNTDGLYPASILIRKPALAKASTPAFGAPVATASGMVEKVKTKKSKENSND